MYRFTEDKTVPFIVTQLKKGQHFSYSSIRKITFNQKVIVNGEQRDAQKEILILKKISILGEDPELVRLNIGTFFNNFA